MLIGDAAVDKLQKSTVMVVGCGAVGSFAIEALARSGIGHLILIDSDVIEESNINRQLFALSSTVGQPKVAVAKSRIRDINPDICVDAMQIFFDENTNIDARPDFVIDAIDTPASKIAMAGWAAARGAGFVASMGAARKTDISKIRIAPLSKTFGCPLASKIRRMARDAGLADYDVVFSSEVAAPAFAGGHALGSVVTVTGAFGLYLANYVICGLANS